MIADIEFGQRGFRPSFLCITILPLGGRRTRAARTLVLLAHVGRPSRRAAATVRSRSGTSLYCKRRGRRRRRPSRPQLLIDPCSTCAGRRATCCSRAGRCWSKSSSAIPEFFMMQLPEPGCRTPPAAQLAGSSLCGRWGSRCASTRAKELLRLAPRAILQCRGGTDDVFVAFEAAH